MADNEKKERKGFKKVLGITDMLVVAFGAMIGWGWVVSSGGWIQSGGVIGTIIGFIIGGAMIFFVGLVYSELTPALPKTGGERVFALKAFGPVGSYICIWALILSYIGVVCYEAVSLPTILQYLFPNMLQGYMYTIAGFDVYATWVSISVGFTIIITILNLVGVKKAAIFQKILTVIIALVGILLFVASLFSGNPANVGDQAFKGANFWDSFNNIIRIAMITPFFLFGFDVIPQTSEEINVPLKKIGKVMLLSIILAVGFYSIVTLGIGFVFNSEDIANSLSTTGLVTADAMAKAFNSSVMAKVMIVGGLCGIVTSWNSFLIGGSRAIYSMADSFMIPRTFAKTTKKNNTPYFAILLVAALSIIAPFFGRTMLVWIVDAANFACCLAYCLVSISFLVIRKKHPDMERPFKIKHPWFVGIMAIVLSAAIVVMYLIPGTGTTLLWQEWIIVGAWILLGVAFFIWSKIKNKEKFGYSSEEIDKKQEINDSSTDGMESKSKE